MLLNFPAKLFAELSLQLFYSKIFPAEFIFVGIFYYNPTKKSRYPDSKLQKSLAFYLNLILSKFPRIPVLFQIDKKSKFAFTFQQIKGLHTFIRNANTSRDEFIFYSNRLIRLVIEYALSLMPFKDVSIDTPQGITYSGKRMSSNRICGVSILRAGETMEQAVSEVCKNIRIGKILIQTNQITGEPEVS